MNTEELKKYYGLFTDCWKYFRKYAEKAVDKEDYWKQMVDEGVTLWEKYENGNFARKLISDTQVEIDRIVREK